MITIFAQRLTESLLIGFPRRKDVNEAAYKGLVHSVLTWVSSVCDTSGAIRKRAKARYQICNRKIQLLNWGGV